MKIRITSSLQAKNVVHWDHKPEIRKLLEINNPPFMFVERIKIRRDYQKKCGPGFRCPQAYPSARQYGSKKGWIGARCFS